MMRPNFWNDYNNICQTGCGQKITFKYTLHSFKTTHQYCQDLIIFLILKIIHSFVDVDVDWLVYIAKQTI